MRVTSESFTVIPHPQQREISVLIAGLNIVLDLEEARELKRQLRTGMQVAEPAPGHIAGPLERTAPTTKKAVASQRDVGASQRDVGAGNGSAGGTAEEPTVLSSEPAIAGAEETAGDKRGGKRRRGLFKVLGLEGDGAAASGG
jgi:hypothetical protein